MPQRETYRKTIEQAVTFAGGELNLSLRLKVPLATLRNWLAGVEAIPDHAFLDAVDVITVEKMRIATKRPQTDA